MTHFDRMFLAALRDWLVLPSDAPRAVRDYFRDGIARMEAMEKPRAPWQKNKTDISKHRNGEASE